MRSLLSAHPAGPASLYPPLSPCVPAAGSLPPSGRASWSTCSSSGTSAASASWCAAFLSSPHGRASVSTCIGNRAWPRCAALLPWATCPLGCAATLLGASCAETTLRKGGQQRSHLPGTSSFRIKAFHCSPGRPAPCPLRLPSRLCRAPPPRRSTATPPPSSGRGRSGAGPPGSAPVARWVGRQWVGEVVWLAG